ncbi:hypothetical protein EYZ11_011242 [Aspergillus tanneri]|uniref:Uncharacterized protein n=1 Tax=Aspergillus tanneri TaxID=1220188 RepID=A0A4S3J3M7_9EURO|nr:hypothetical protein EYZ11_011242 [Aspergillus tanneri]
MAASGTTTARPWYAPIIQLATHFSPVLDQALRDALSAASS